MYYLLFKETEEVILDLETELVPLSVKDLVVVGHSDCHLVV